MKRARRSFGSSLFPYDSVIGSAVQKVDTIVADNAVVWYSDREFPTLTMKKVENAKATDNRSSRVLEQHFIIFDSQLTSRSTTSPQDRDKLQIGRLRHLLNVMAIYRMVGKENHSEERHQP